MRTINIKLNADEEVIRLYATRGRRYWLALIVGPDGYRHQENNGGGNYGNLVPHAAIEADIYKRVSDSAQFSGINLVAIETSCAICN